MILPVNHPVRGSLGHHCSCDVFVSGGRRPPTPTFFVPNVSGINKGKHM